MVLVMAEIILKTKIMKIKNLTGPKIRFYRKQQKWTQQTLADHLQAMRVGISRQIIANIETQRCTVTDCEIASIAKTLKIPIVLFFSDDVLADFSGALEIHPLFQNEEKPAAAQTGSKRFEVVFVVEKSFLTGL